LKLWEIIKREGLDWLAGVYGQIEYLSPAPFPDGLQVAEDLLPQSESVKSEVQLEEQEE